MHATKLIIVFPNKDSFSVPLHIVATKRAGRARRDRINLEIQGPEEVAQWAKRNLKWGELSKYCTPQPPTASYHRTMWSGKKVTVRVKY